MNLSQRGAGMSPAAPNGSADGLVHWR